MKSANPDHWDFYKRFRRRIQIYCNDPGGKKSAFREFLLLGPDLLHLCINLVVDKDVPSKHKFKLAAAIAYFISPLDFLPELILGPLGFLDDIAIVAYVLNSLINDVPPEILDRYWAGHQDLLSVIRNIIMVTDRYLGQELLNRLKREIDRIRLPEDPKNQ